MTTANLILVLQDQGVVLSVDGGTLKVKAKKGTVQPDQVEQLKTHKAEVISILQARKKPTRARGFGCAGCGNRIYQSVQAWVLSELPESSPWQYEHKPVVHWQCEGCSAVYEIIGGSRDPQPIN